MAATFNTERVYDVGRVNGNNCLAADVVCLCGPAPIPTARPTAAGTLNTPPRTASLPVKSAARRERAVKEQVDRKCCHSELSVTGLQ